ncbi:MAG: MFS transporter [Planctomycetota bacterium]
MVVFLTLFLDLVGFSLIFPLFPAILDYYTTLEGADSLIGRLVAELQQITGAEDPNGWRVQALFGGVLGSLYSLLQFIFSPIWGRVSDRIGRRPVLLLTVGGMVVSYLLWIFSGSFALLIGARLVGGIMSGNISTATAAMADATSEQDRAKGMGMIGAAFGLGFILGPAIGGLLALFDPLETWPGLASYGINPFSACAAGALLLSLLNFVWVWRAFVETLPPERRQKQPQGRIHPLLGNSGLGALVWRTNLAYWLFMVAFSGMEFTLAFLVRDRLQWGPGAVAGMLCFVGFILALVQGGIVRRVAPRYGEKRVAIAGLVILAPGLFLLASAHSAGAVYLGLVPLAVGSALAIPSLTALASLFAPPERQGAALGAFRSLGALARAIGPIAAGLAYWRYGSALPYQIGGAMLVLPLVILAFLPQPTKRAAA